MPALESRRLSCLFGGHFWRTPYVLPPVVPPRCIATNRSIEPRTFSWKNFVGSSGVCRLTGRERLAGSTKARTREPQRLRTSAWDASSYRSKSFPYRCMKAAVDMLLSMGWFHKSQPFYGNSALFLTHARFPARSSRLIPAISVEKKKNGRCWRRRDPRDDLLALSTNFSRTYSRIRFPGRINRGGEVGRGWQQSFANTCTTWQVETVGWTEVRMRIRRFPW